MNIDEELTDLIEPLAGENACGEDLSNSSAYAELMAEIDQLASQQTTIEVNWRDFLNASDKLLVQTRDLNLLLVNLVSRTALRGILGLRDGLYLLLTAAERYWDSIYPLPDFESEQEDCFVERLAIINNISGRYKSLGDQYAVVDKLRETPIARDGARSRGISYQDIYLAENPGDATPRHSLDQIRNYFFNLDKEELAEIIQAIEDSLELISKFETFVESTCNKFNEDESYDFTPVNTLNLEVLNEELKLIRKKIEEYAGSTSSADSNSEGEATSEVVVPGAVVKKVVAVQGVGEINGPEDVVKAIDKIISFYEKNEPSSPIPFLLRRTKKLVNANFMDIISNIHKDSVYELKKLFDIQD